MGGKLDKENMEELGKQFCLALLFQAGKWDAGQADNISRKKVFEN